MSRHMLIAALAAIAFLAARPGLAADAKQMEDNKKSVAAFYDAVLNQKDFDAAAKYLGSRYTQHNPGAADGPAKTAIFGGNNARLCGIEPKRAQLELRQDRFAQIKADYDKVGPTPTHTRYGYVHPSVAQFPHEVFA